MSAKMKNVALDRCLVCNGMRINSNCMNMKCPMYAMNMNRRRALKDGLTATGMFTRNLDVMSVGRRKRGVR